MSEPFGDGAAPIDPELDRLTRRARQFDEQLGDIRRDAEASYVGSEARRRFTEARDASERAWQDVTQRVAQLHGLADDLRDPLTNDG